MLKFCAFAAFLVAFCVGYSVVIPPKNTTETNNSVAANAEPAVVNLPHGEKFIYVVPGGRAMEMGLTNNASENIYVTRNALNPQLITFWGMGTSPHSWEVRRRVQEN